MSWKDRIRKATYKAPSGLVMEFAFDDFTSSVDTKTSIFQFPQKTGSYVQDNGRTGRKIPITAYFYGADCDLEADAFMGLLGETGQGVLNHPRYGTIKVVPTGTISRSDPIVNEANQVIISVEFYETTGVIWPVVGASFLNDVPSGITAFRSASASAFTAGLRLRKPGSLVNVQAGFLDRISDATSQFSRLVGAPSMYADEFLGDPLTVANTIAVALGDPARAASLLRAKLSAYGNLLEGIVGKEKNIPKSGQIDQDASVNEFQVNDFFAGNYVVSAFESISVEKFRTRASIFRALSSVQETIEAWGTWRDSIGEALTSRVDPPEPYASATAVFGLVAGALIDASFSVQQERSYTVREVTNPIELAAELYGDLSKLDQLITTNDLGGDFLVDIPPGRVIKYYV